MVWPMNWVEVLWTQEPDRASRAERLLRNADDQSWTGGDDEWALVLVRSRDVTTALSDVPVSPQFGNMTMGNSSYTLQQHSNTHS